jgi:hypothetical protein
VKPKKLEKRDQDTPKAQKLRLSRETLRRLDRNELGKVLGGVGPSGDPFICDSEDTGPHIC